MITLISSGLPGGSSAKILQQLVSGNNAKLIYSSAWKDDYARNPIPRQKNADHVIKLLTGVLQQGAEGNNQFTNPKNPIFHIDKLESKLLNGRSVLELEGFYVGKNNDESQAYFTEIFIPARLGNGLCAHILMYQAASHADYMANEHWFQEALSSVEWKKTFQ